MTSDNVIAVTFEHDSGAYEALSTLKELDGQGQASVGAAAVVQRDQDGRVIVKDQVRGTAFAGTETGALIGLLVGILGGPLGVLIGGTTGLLLGSAFDADDAEEHESVLAALSATIRPRHTALLAVVSERSAEVIDTAMARLGGQVLRRGVAEVEAEIAAAEDAARAAKRAARVKLRDERRRHLSDDVREKVDALKQKL